MLIQEAELVADRLNRLEATRAALLQMAVGSLLSKDVGEQFRKVLDDLN